MLVHVPENRKPASENPNTRKRAEEGLDHLPETVRTVVYINDFCSCPRRARPDTVLTTTGASREVVLREGQGLVIPAKHWHYVRSLTPSFSVNFWWR